MTWPPAAMPLAGGNPIPSGRTSMFSAAIWAAVAGWPMPVPVPANDAVEHFAEVGAAYCDQLGASGLNVAGLVGRPALEDRFAPIPVPREAKSRVADRQHRLLQRRVAPGFTAIGAHFHFCD